MTSVTPEPQQNPANNDFYNDVVDKASEYDYCMVLNPNKDGTGLDESGLSYVNTMKRAGLDIFPFVSHDKEAIFVLIRAPLEKFRSFCDQLDFSLLLDPVVIDDLAKHGSEGIAPFQINHNPDECILTPYENIYGPYKIDVPDNLYWRGPNKSHPFKELIRLKVTMMMIQSKPADGGEHLKINKYLLQKKILGFFPLHNPVKRDKLAKDWMVYFRFPWNDPIDAIKEYFGEKIALYFTFCMHYVTWLIIPAIVGIPVQVVVFATGDYSHPVLPPFSAIIVIWAIFMLEFWKRKQRVYALKWGMIDFEKNDKDRPEFKALHGHEKVPSYIHGRPVKYFPSKKRRSLITQAFILVGLLIGVVIAAVATIYILRYFSIFSQTIASIVNAVQIKIFNAIYSLVAELLTDRENHRTETHYEDSLISKLFLFQFVNSYASFFYIAFIAENLGECTATGSESCMKTLALNLGIIFGTAVTVGNIIELIVPYLTFRYNLWSKELTMESYLKIPRPEREFLKNKYNSTSSSIEDYAELAIQFGYMVLFISALPIAAFYCLICNLFEIKTDGYKLLNILQRPVPTSIEDIGTWQSIFTIVAVVAVITNAGLIVFTMSTLDHLRYGDKLWIFIGFMIFCYSLQTIAITVIPDEPAKISIQLQRTEVIVDKIVYKVKDDVLAAAVAVPHNEDVPMLDYRGEDPALNRGEHARHPAVNSPLTLASFPVTNVQKVPIADEAFDIVV